NTRHTDHTNVSLDGNLSPEITGTLRAMTPGDLRIVSLADGSARILFLRSFTPGREVIDGSHILITYKGASAADPSVTRTKEEARSKAAQIREQLLKGADFTSLARTQSDGPSAKEGGSLGTFGRGEMVPAFEEAAFTLTEGGFSTLIETQFGFHIIRMDRGPRKTGDIANFNELLVSGPDALTRANIFLNRMQRGDVKKMDDLLVIRSFFFSLLPTGWKDTALDGKHFRAASVTTDSVTNIPVVQIMFDDEGGQIFHELTKRNVGKRIAIFVGGELISAPTVQSAIPSGTAVITGSRSFEEARTLAQDLNTGAIPAPIHLSGQRTVEATLGNQALAQTMKAAAIGLILLMIYIAFAYRLPGVTANIALLAYTLFFIALLKLPLFLFSKNYIVMTTAGMAGTILSIGMAIDGNILIFERMKEELRKGKLLKTAIEIGFDRAWPSIRDANLSTLLTSAILFFIGTSIVRGFAITLSLGIITSMFILIIVSRLLLRKIAQTKLAEHPWLFMRQ
ncbi:protein-export membrane protein SecD, partial [Candidatus Peribacteria bacterium RIFCSPHIGHO2_01_FULL_51_9]